MHYLIYAHIGDNIWAARVLTENNQIIEPEAGFSYSVPYQIDKFYYFDEYYFKNDPKFKRVMFIDIAEVRFIGSTRYHYLANVITPPPRFNPPQTLPVHYNVALKYIIDNFLQNTSFHVISEEQQSTPNANFSLQAQNLSYNQKDAIELKVEKDVSSYQSDIEDEIAPSTLEQEEISTATTSTKKKKESKSKHKYKNPEQNAEELIIKTVKEFNELSKLLPDNSNKIYELLYSFVKNYTDPKILTDKLDIDIKLCHTLLLHSYTIKKEIDNTVKIFLFSKFSEFTHDAHKEYIDDNKKIAHHIAALAFTCNAKAESSPLNKIISIYKKIQSDIDKNTDNRKINPQQALKQALQSLKFEQYKELEAQDSQYKTTAKEIFTELLNSLKQPKSINISYKATQRNSLKSFLGEFDFDIVKILKDEKHHPEVKIAAQYNLDKLSPEQYYITNKEINFINIYAECCKKMRYSDESLKEKLLMLQENSEHWFDKTSKETIDTLANQKDKELRTDLLPIFANICNDRQQTTLMLAIKNGYKLEVIKAILKEAGTSILQIDNEGQSLLHYLAKYYKKNYLSILDGLNKEQLLIAKEKNQGDTYLHYLIRYQTPELIKDFIKELEDQSLAIISKNNFGETVATLLDDKEEELSEVRELLYSNIAEKFSKIPDSAVADANGFFTSSSNDARLFELANSNPMRLIDILDTRTTLIKNIIKNHSNSSNAVLNFFKVLGVNKHIDAKGNTLHWNLTECIMHKPIKENIALTKKYENSIFYKDCLELMVSDTLAFKLLVNMDVSNIKELTPKSKLPEAMHRTLVFLENNIQNIPNFIMFIATKKLAATLAYFFVMHGTEYKNICPIIINQVNNILFKPENIFIIHEATKLLKNEYRTDVIVVLTDSYLRMENYKALSKLVADNFTQHKEIASILNNNFKKAISNRASLVFIDKIRVESIELIAFMLNNTDENHFQHILAVLSETAKSEDDINAVLYCIDKIKSDNLKHLIKSLAKAGAYMNNILLLKSIYDIHNPTFSVATLTVMAKVCNDGVAGITYILDKSIAKVSGVPVDSQKEIILLMYKQFKAIDEVAKNALLEKLTKTKDMQDRTSIVLKAKELKLTAKASLVLELVEENIKSSTDNKKIDASVLDLLLEYKPEVAPPETSQLKASNTSKRLTMC